MSGKQYRDDFLKVVSTEHDRTYRAITFMNLQKLCLLTQDLNEPVNILARKVEDLMKLHHYLTWRYWKKMSAWEEESVSFINITSSRLPILQWMTLPSASMDKSNWT